MKRHLKWILLPCSALLFSSCGQNSSTSSDPISSTPEPVVQMRTIAIVEGIVGGTASLSKTEAKSGEEVQVTIASDEGFHFKEIRADSITFHAIEEGSKYSFIVPESDVVITIEFEPDGKYSRVTDIYSVVAGTSCSVETGVILEPGIQNVIFSFTEAIAQSPEYYVYVNDQFYALKENEYFTEFSAEIELPEGEVTLCFAKDIALPNPDSGYRVAISEGEGYQMLGYKNTSKYSAANFHLLLDKGYALTSIERRKMGAEQYEEVNEFNIEKFDSLIRFFIYAFEDTEIRINVSKVIL